MKLSKFTRTNLLAAIKQHITTAANRAIYDNTGKPAEPKLTKALAMYIIRGLHNALYASVPNCSFKIHGIFCHQFPYVKFVQSPQKKCELGDLLFIYDENTAENGNALLLQAKKILGVQFTPKGNEQTQLDLYTQSPEFTYKLSNENRKIPNDSEFRGAQYMLLFPPYDNSCQYRIVPSQNIDSKPLANTDFLADNIAGLLCGEAGAQFNISKDDDWSKIITDFLAFGSSNTYASKQLNQRSFCCTSPFLYIIQNLDGKDFESENIVKSSIEEDEFLFSMTNFAPIDAPPNGEHDEAEEGKPFLIVHISAVTPEKRETPNPKKER